MANKSINAKIVAGNLLSIRKAISEEIKALVDKLLLERISLAGIARVVGVSKRWLQNYVNNKYDDIPKRSSPKKQRAFDPRM